MSPEDAPVNSNTSRDGIADIKLFEKLMGMSDKQIITRFKDPLSAHEIFKYGTPGQQEAISDLSSGQGPRRKLSKQERITLMSNIMALMPYSDRVQKLHRPEEVAEDALTGPFLADANAQLGTSASTLPELIGQLGELRFGHRPIIVDTFAGGGSIPFEAARLGCDVIASDLNPIACMLTWGDLNLVGDKEVDRAEMKAQQVALFKAVDKAIASLSIDFDEAGNKAKVFLYCLETHCPVTGWLIPLLPSLVISEARNVVGRLVPNRELKRFDIQIVVGASAAEMNFGSRGTVRDNKMVYELDGEIFSIPIKNIRGDRRLVEGRTSNDLRLWEKDDFTPREDDVFGERLYCIQWITKDTIAKSRQTTFFAAPTPFDMEREKRVVKIVSDKLTTWQNAGVVSDMEIETGKENEGPIRTNGWKFWHQLFMPRAILTAALIAEYGKHQPHAAFSLSKYLDNNSKSCRWAVAQSRGDGGAKSTFDNQALKTIFNWAYRTVGVAPWNLSDLKHSPVCGRSIISCADARQLMSDADIAITDPPYADAVNYHEITEFFIAWLRKRVPVPFQEWTWDSRRPLAIKGDGASFREGMVAAYKALSNHLPANGLQIVMFTHRDSGVWGDMAQIFWGAGLRVMSAWYIATETTSELKKGGYVQGTVILVLRKRAGHEQGYKDEIVQEVKVEVAGQIDTMAGLNQSLKGRGRIENLFEDADLQMAGYAAALRVLTRYATIDGINMAQEATRPQNQGERGLVNEVIEFAVQVANEHMVPEGMSAKTWENLSGAERFYFKMMDIESTGAKKLDNYQNFAKAFRVGRYEDLMGNTEPNKAALKTAKQFKTAGFEGNEFGMSKSRALLYAIYEVAKEIEGDDVLSHLRDLVRDYFNVHEDLMALADYVATKRETIDEEESRAARILHGLIRNERLG